MEKHEWIEGKVQAWAKTHIVSLSTAQYDWLRNTLADAIEWGETFEAQRIRTYLEKTAHTYDTSKTQDYREVVQDIIEWLFSL